jgi:YD repeat-containing protein
MLRNRWVIAGSKITSANGRPITVDTVGATYDALGRMVEQNRSGSYTEIVYSLSGAKLALMTGLSTLQKGYVPLTGGTMAVYNSSGLAFYRHSDWEGSSRFASTTSRTMYFDGAYAPFGEQYATTDLSYTGQQQDAERSRIASPFWDARPGVSGMSFLKVGILTCGFYVVATFVLEVGLWVIASLKGFGIWGPPTKHLGFYLGIVFGAVWGALWLISFSAAWWVVCHGIKARVSGP